MSWFVFGAHAEGNVEGRNVKNVFFQHYNLSSGVPRISPHGCPTNPFTWPLLPLDTEAVRDALASIKAAFGLTTKDLASVLRVERQTIYAWIRGENEPSDENNRRIRSLMTLAAQWNTLSNLPARKLLRIKFENTTLLEELSQVNLDFDKIRSVLHWAAKLSHEVEKQKKHDPGISVQMSEYDIITHSAFIPKENE